MPLVTEYSFFSFMRWSALEEAENKGVLVLGTCYMYVHICSHGFHHTLRTGDSVLPCIYVQNCYTNSMQASWEEVACAYHLASVSTALVTAGSHARLYWSLQAEEGVNDVSDVIENGVAHASAWADRWYRVMNRRCIAPQRILYRSHLCRVP